MIDHYSIGNAGVVVPYRAYIFEFIQGNDQPDLLWQLATSLLQRGVERDVVTSRLNLSFVNVEYSCVIEILENDTPINISQV